MDEEQGIAGHHEDEFLDVEDWDDNLDGKEAIVVPTVGQASVALRRDTVLHISIPRKRRRSLEIVLTQGTPVDEDETSVDEDEDEDEEQQQRSSSSYGVDVDHHKVRDLLPRPAPTRFIRSEANIAEVHPQQQKQEEGVSEVPGVATGDGGDNAVRVEPSSKPAAEEKDDNTTASGASARTVKFGGPVYDEEDGEEQKERQEKREEQMEQEEQEEEQEMVEVSKSGLRFAAIEKPFVTSTEGEAAKRGVRFVAERESDDEDETEEEKPSTKLVKFADAMATPKKKKSVRFARGTKKSKLVRFASEDGGKRKFSLLESPKVVRFLLPTTDPVSKKQRMRVFLPGVEHRTRRDTIKQCSTIRVYPDPPLWLVLKLMETERFRHLSGHGRAKACHVLGWIGVVLSAMAFVLCFVILAVYLHLRPRIPHMRIEDFDVFTDLERLDYDALEAQQVEDQGNYYAYRTWVSGIFVVNYGNLNTAVDLYNEYVESSVFYKGVFLGKSRVRHIVVPRKSNILLEFEINNKLLLPLQVGYTLYQEMDLEHLNYVCEFIIKARLSSVGTMLTSRTFWHRVRCYILLADDYIVQSEQECKDYNY